MSSTLPLVERLCDGLQHGLSLLQDFVVPVAEDPVALGLEKFGATVVVVALRLVLGAVELDDESVLLADEVGDVRADGHLAAEFAAEQPAASQSLPEPVLGIGAVAAEVAGVCEEGWVVLVHRCV